LADQIPNIDLGHHIIIIIIIIVTGNVSFSLTRCTSIHETLRKRRHSSVEWSIIAVCCEFGMETRAMDDAFEKDSKKVESPPDSCVGHNGKGDLLCGRLIQSPTAMKRANPAGTCMYHGSIVTDGENTGVNILCFVIVDENPIQILY
jgi:hypothetical protein